MGEVEARSWLGDEGEMMREDGVISPEWPVGEPGHHGDIAILTVQAKGTIGLPVDQDRWEYVRPSLLRRLWRALTPWKVHTHTFIKRA